MEELKNPCPEVIGLPDILEPEALTGREMNLDTVLLITGLKPRQTYTVKEISGNETEYSRLYGFINNNHIRPDGARSSQGRMVNIYWGATLINELPLRARYKAVLVQRGWQMWRGLQKGGWVERKYQTSRFLNRWSQGHLYPYRTVIYKTILWLYKLLKH